MSRSLAIRTEGNEAGGVRLPSSHKGEEMELQAESAVRKGEVKPCSTQKSTNVKAGSSVVNTHTKSGSSVATLGIATHAKDAGASATLGAATQSRVAGPVVSTHTRDASASAALRTSTHTMEASVVAKSLEQPSHPLPLEAKKGAKKPTPAPVRAPPKDLPGSLQPILASKSAPYTRTQTAVYEGKFSGSTEDMAYSNEGKVYLKGDGALAHTGTSTEPKAAAYNEISRTGTSISPCELDTKGKCASLPTAAGSMSLQPRDGANANALNGAIKHQVLPVAASHSADTASALRNGKNPLPHPPLPKKQPSVKAQLTRKPVISSASEAPSRKLVERARFELQRRLIGNKSGPQDGNTQVLIEAALQHLTPLHIMEVAEHRKEEGVCGNVACAKPCMEDNGQKKWKLDAARQVIYDWNLLSNFCSIACYESFLAFKSQLSEESTHMRLCSASSLVEIFSPNEKTLNLHALGGSSEQEGVASRSGRANLLEGASNANASSEDVSSVDIVNALNRGGGGGGVIAESIVGKKTSGNAFVSSLASRAEDPPSAMLKELKNDMRVLASAPPRELGKGRASLSSTSALSESRVSCVTAEGLEGDEGEEGEDKTAALGVHSGATKVDAVVSKGRSGFAASGKATRTHAEADGMASAIVKQDSLLLYPKKLSGDTCSLMSDTHSLVTHTQEGTLSQVGRHHILAPVDSLLPNSVSHTHEAAESIGSIDEMYVHSRAGVDSVTQDMSALSGSSEETLLDEHSLSCVSQESVSARKSILKKSSSIGSFSIDSEPSLQSSDCNLKKVCFNCSEKDEVRFFEKDNPVKAMLTSKDACDLLLEEPAAESRRQAHDESPVPPSLSRGGWFRRNSLDHRHTQKRTDTVKDEDVELMDHNMYIEIVAMPFGGTSLFKRSSSHGSSSSNKEGKDSKHAHTRTEVEGGSSKRGDLSKLGHGEDSKALRNSRSRSPSENLSGTRISADSSSRNKMLATIFSSLMPGNRGKEAYGDTEKFRSSRDDSLSSWNDQPKLLQELEGCVYADTEDPHSKKLRSRSSSDGGGAKQQLDKEQALSQTASHQPSHVPPHITSDTLSQSETKASSFPSRNSPQALMMRSSRFLDGEKSVVFDYEGDSYAPTQEHGKGVASAEALEESRNAVGVALKNYSSSQPPSVYTLPSSSSTLEKTHTPSEILHSVYTPHPSDGVCASLITSTPGKADTPRSRGVAGSDLNSYAAQSLNISPGSSLSTSTTLTLSTSPRKTVNTSTTHSGSTSTSLPRAADGSVSTLEGVGALAPSKHAMSVQGTHQPMQKSVHTPYMEDSTLSGASDEDDDFFNLNDTDSDSTDGFEDASDAKDMMLLRTHKKTHKAEADMQGLLKRMLVSQAKRLSDFCIVLDLLTNCLSEESRTFFSNFESKGGNTRSLMSREGLIKDASPVMLERVNLLISNLLPHLLPLVMFLRPVMTALCLTFRPQKAIPSLLPRHLELIGVFLCKAYLVHALKRCKSGDSTHTGASANPHSEHTFYTLLPSEAEITPRSSISDDSSSSNTASSPSTISTTEELKESLLSKENGMSLQNSLKTPPILEGSKLSHPSNPFPQQVARVLAHTQNRESSLSRSSATMDRSSMLSPCLKVPSSHALIDRVSDGFGSALSSPEGSFIEEEASSENIRFSQNTAKVPSLNLHRSSVSSSLSSGSTQPVQLPLHSPDSTEKAYALGGGTSPASPVSSIDSFLRGESPTSSLIDGVYVHRASFHDLLFADQFITSVIKTKYHLEKYHIGIILDLFA